MCLGGTLGSTGGCLGSRKLRHLGHPREPLSCGASSVQKPSGLAGGLSPAPPCPQQGLHSSSFKYRQLVGTLSLPFSVQLDRGVHTRRNAVYLAQCTENCVGVMSLAACKLQLRESQNIQDPLGPGKPYFITKDLGYNKMSLTDFYHFLK